MISTIMAISSSPMKLISSIMIVRNRMIARHNFNEFSTAYSFSIIIIITIVY